MNDVKRSLAQMFDLLNRERELLVAQISQERDRKRRSELNRELKQVSGILSEINASL